MHSLHGQHNSHLSSLVNRAPKDDRLRRAVYAAICLTAGEPLLQSKEDLTHWMRFVPKSREVMRSLKEMYVMLGKEIDDRLDTMPPEEMLRLGSTAIGSEPCDFLNNFLTEANWITVDRFTRTGLLPREDLMVICNLFAEMHIKGAALAIQLKQEPTNPDLRERAAAEHIRSSELCVILLTHIYRHKKLDPSTNFTFEKIAEMNPSAVRAGRILEYYDDVRDFFEDYAEERRTGIPNPNSVLAAFMGIINKEPLEEQKKHLMELDNFVNDTQKNKTSITFSQIPHTLKLAMYEIVHRSEAEASKIHGLSKDLREKVGYDLAIDLIGAQIKQGWSTNLLGLESSATR